MTAHQQTLQLANGPAMWLFCILTIGLVFFQAWIFLRTGRQYASVCTVTRLDVKRSLRAGPISTLGPALSIFVVGLGLIANLGSPLTLARLSVVGNAAYEASAAEMGALATGTSINSADYTMVAFTASVWVMNLGGICMLLSTLFFLKPLDRLTKAISHKTHKGLLIGLSASLASFGYFVVDYADRDIRNLVAAVIGFLGVRIFYHLSARTKAKWLKEWALALSILAAVIVVMLIP